MDEYDEWDRDTYTRIEKGDILFRNDDKRTQYDVDNDYAYQDFRQKHFFGYALAYKEGADRLVEAIAEKDYSQYAFTLPIIFLYRHYLELHLKSLIMDGKKALGQAVDTIPTGHNILRLWDQLKPVLAQIQVKSFSLDKEEQIAVEACIKEFSDMDEKSEAFRYPFSKEGKLLLAKNASIVNLRYIDLQHLAENMEKLAAFFTEADMMILLYGGKKSSK